MKSRTELDNHLDQMLEARYSNFHGIPVTLDSVCDAVAQIDQQVAIGVFPPLDELVVLDNELSEMSDLLKNNEALKVFVSVFSCTGFRGDDLIKLLGVFRDHASLEMLQLEIAGNALGLDEAKSISSFISNSQSCLSLHLDLSTNDLDDEACMNLVKAKSKNTTLQYFKIDLSNNNKISEKSLVAWKDLLMRDTSIMSLGLSCDNQTLMDKIDLCCYRNKLLFKYQDNPVLCKQILNVCSAAGLYDSGEVAPLKFLASLTVFKSFAFTKQDMKNTTPDILDLYADVASKVTGLPIELQELADYKRSGDAPKSESDDAIKPKRK